ncbi:MAG TPA: TAT-variant-translocated molybdopterin oxidoreductase, partial [Gemmatimonadales bacterium]|nr:TAT-variant-translocated molybdopterin oxidoreductase [Gemmatimonadales bacterium]
MKDYWRALEERIDSPEFQAELRAEFPAGADQLDRGISRRSFVRLLGASMALAGIGGCFRRPREPILPYVHRPEDVTPGQPLHYATAMLLGGYATGLLVESHAGRPTKIEGNPDHPASLGAAGVFQQASLLELYDPHRARTITRRGRRANAAALARLLDPSAIARRAGARGHGLHLLLEPTSSPLIGRQLDRILERFPAAQIHWYAPLASRTQLDATAAAFGRALQPIYQPAAAEVIAVFEDDIFGAGPFHLRYAREFAGGRRLTAPGDSMNRLYVAEGRPTITGGIADHRLPSRPSRMPLLLPALLNRLRGSGASDPALTEPEQRWIEALARDLQAHRGAALVIAGEMLPPEAQALAHLATAALDGAGHVVRYIDPVLLPGATRPGLGSLVNAMQQGDIETLIVVDGNPVYTAPADIDFSAALTKVPNSVH